MKEKLIARLLALLIEKAAELLTPELFKSYVDRGLDMIEDLVKNSKTKIDDITVLPLIEKIRDIMAIPDSDEPKQGGD